MQSLIGVWVYLGFYIKHQSVMHLNISLFKETKYTMTKVTTYTQNLWNTSATNYISLASARFYNPGSKFSFKDFRVYLNYDTDGSQLLVTVHAEMSTLCSEECLECASPKDCSVCKAGFKLSSGECIPSCNYSCETCSDVNSDHCLSCINPLMLNPDFSCKLVCVTDYYVGDNRVCVKCPGECLTCINPATCYACATGFFQYKTQCKSNCPDDTWVDSGSCSSCHFSCDGCTGPSNKDCKACIDPFKQVEGACTQCERGYFYDSGVCSPCQNLCEICSNSEVCSQCFEFTFVGPDFDCATECSEGYFADQNRTCQKCHPNCANCVGAEASDCLSCTDNNSSLNNGICECLPGYYDSDSSDTLTCVLIDCSVQGFKDLSQCQIKKGATSSEESTAKSVQTATTTGFGSVMIGSFITGSPDLFVAMFMTIELLAYLPLIDIAFTKAEAEMIMGSNQLDNLPEFVSGLDCTEAKSRKSSYNFECSNLLKTAQKELALFAVMVFLSSLAYLNAKFSTRKVVVERLMKLQQKIGLAISFRMTIKVLIFIESSRELTFQSVASWGISICFTVWVGWQLYRLSRKALKGQWDTELNPNRCAQLFNTCLLFHRVTYASSLVLIDSPVVQLSVLASTTILVSFTQLIAFALIVRPFVEVKLTIQFVGLHIVIVYFNTVLVLIGKGWISNSFTSQSFIVAVISVLLTSILSLLAGVFSKVIEIIRLDSNSEVVV